MSTLDREIGAQYNGEVHVLKVDTQGFDLAVLTGGSRVFEQQRVRLLSVELNFDALYRGQGHWLDILQFLDQRGMRLIDFYDKWRRADGISWCTALFVRRATI